MAKFNLILLLIFLGSCASNVKNEVEADKKNVRPFITREAVIDRAAEIVEHAQGLTEKQKEEFIELQGDVWIKVHELNDEIKTLKVLLFKSLVNENYSEQKQQEIINQIKKAHTAKLDLMIDAFRKTKKILGKEAKNIPFSNLWKHHGNYVRE